MNNLSTRSLFMECFRSYLKHVVAIAFMTFVIYHGCVYFYDYSLWYAFNIFIAIACYGCILMCLSTLDYANSYIDTFTLGVLTSFFSVVPIKLGVHLSPWVSIIITCVGFGFIFPVRRLVVLWAYGIKAKAAKKIKLEREKRTESERHAIKKSGKKKMDIGVLIVLVSVGFVGIAKYKGLNLEPYLFFLVIGLISVYIGLVQTEIGENEFPSSASKL